MSNELKAKFIQHLNHKQRETGFTLIELLVVIIIIGILAAIALPNFLNQAAKAKQTEAKQNLGLINRVQSVHRSQNDRFASSFDLLATGTLIGTGTNASTINYSYTLVAGIETTSIIAQARDVGLKGYSGATNRYINSSSLTIVGSVLCEAPIPNIDAPIAPIPTTTDAPLCIAPYIRS